MVKVKNDLTGQKINHLMVLYQIEDYISPSGVHYAQWLCECDCEDKNKVKVLGSNLTRGLTQSCGCVRKTSCFTTGSQNHKQNPYDIDGEFGIMWSLNTNEEIYFDICCAKDVLAHCWTVDNNGYPSTTISGKRVLMHVFLGYKNYDHIDKNKRNNRIENLRQCTTQENNRNKSVGKNNRSGIIGVYWKDDTNKWYAQITIDYKAICLGSFYDKDDAIKARLIAEQKYFGKFAPQKHLYEQYGITPQNN